MKALFRGIYTAFDNNEALKAALTGGLHKVKAKQGAVCPYAVFTMVDRVPANTLDETYEEFMVQFNIFSESDTADAVCDLFELLDAVYENGTLTVDGYTFNYMRRRLSVMPPSDVEGVFQYTARYEVLIEKN